MKTTIKKTGISLLMLFVFALARAGFIPVITHTSGCSGHDGSIHFSGLQSDGPGPFTITLYNINTGYYFADSVISASLDTFSVYGLAPGLYDFSVLQNGSPSTLIEDSLTLSTAVQVSERITGTTCPYDTGSIIAIPYGAASPFTYQWSTGATTSGIYHLAPGLYTLRVTDANGCTSDLITTAIASSSPVAVHIAVSGSSCNPLLTANVSGSTGALSYIWNTGATTQSISGLPQIPYYTVTVTDANGCRGDALDSVSFYPLSIDSGILTPATCGYSTGAISIRVGNGTRPFSYLWSNGGTDSIITGLSAGTYTATVTDALGCSASLPFTVSSRSTLDLDSSVYINPDCRGHLGSLTVHVSNGVSPLTFAWSNGATDSALTGLSAGGYQLSVTDAHGCQGINYYYIAQQAIQVNTAGKDYNLCGDSSAYAFAYTGSSAISHTSLSYLWSDGSTQDSIVHLGSGIYTVTATDAISGCTASASFSVRDSNSLNLYMYGIHDPACGTSTGSMAVYASGSHSSFLWSNGATTDTIYGLSAGTYTVTVTQGLCTASLSRTLTALSYLTVSIVTTPTACDTAIHSGSATAIVSGGTPPYTYDWYSTYNGVSPNTVTHLGSTQTISGLGFGGAWNQAGIWTWLTVQVSDASTCPQAYGGTDTATISREYGCHNDITGYLFYDLNGNCSPDAGELGPHGSYLSATDAGGVTYWASPDSTGYYDIHVLQGIYTVVPHISSASSCISSTCTPSRTVTFSGTAAQASAGNDFGISTSSSFDLAVHIGDQGASPGQQRQYWVDYINNGTAPVSNAVLTFVYDANITLVSTSPAYTSHNAATHTITWDIAAISALSASQAVYMSFDIPSSLSLGSMLSAHADIAPAAGDCDPLDNSQDLMDTVTSSHDPNEKEVSPAGNLSAADSVLHYTIRFQNTGNAPASRVVITDMLSANVNPATVKAGAASAAYKFALSGTGLMTFTFDGINLPDSAHGDSSRGFVTYSVHTNPDLAIGSQVNNTASIYFDLNPAIVTNTTVSFRSDVNTGMHDLTNTTMTAQVIPNPAHDIAIIALSGSTGTIALMITDALGQPVISAHIDSRTYTLDAGTLAPGLYFYTAQDAGGNRAAGKISVVK